MNSSATDREVTRLIEADRHFSDARRALSEAIDAIARGREWANETTDIELLAEVTVEQVVSCRRLLGMVRREIEGVTGQPRITGNA